MHESNQDRIDEFFDEYLSRENPPGWSDDELEPDNERPERFRIDSDMTAAWAMRKLRAAMIRRDSNVEIANDQIAQIQSWLETSNRMNNRDVEFFTRLLTDYALDCRRNPDDGRKSVSVPGGKITTRTGSLRWSVDAEAFIEWARVNHPDLIRVKEEPVLTDIKTTFQTKDGFVFADTGEIVPGVHVEETEPTATVKID